jgi:hypothetical protein
MSNKVKIPVSSTNQQKQIVEPTDVQQVNPQYIPTIPNSIKLQAVSNHEEYNN